MIRINLLPVEKRRPERTPFRRILVVGVAAGILAVGGVVCAGILLRYFGVSGEIESLNRQKAELEPRVRRYELVQQRFDALQGDLKAMDAAAPRPPQKFEWWKVLNDLWYVVTPLQPRGLYLTKIEGFSGPQETLSMAKLVDPAAREGPARAMTLMCESYHRSELLGLRFRQGLMASEGLVGRMPRMNLLHGFREARVSPLDELPEGVEEPEWKMSFKIDICTEIQRSAPRPGEPR